MIITKPDYYDRFRCLGGNCPNTCCGNWEIGIDEVSLERYAGLRGDFGREVRNAVDWMGECFLQKDYRCCLLTEEGLCGLQMELGEDLLCDTCRSFPRHVEEFEGRREYTLSVSCPEAARMILERGMGEITATETEEEDPYEYEDFDHAYFAELLALRKRLTESEDFTFGHAAGGGDRYEERKQLLSYLSGFEEIDHRWKAYLRDIRERLYSGGQEAYERLITRNPVEKAWLRNLRNYFLWVYLPGAVYDGDLEGKIRMAAFFTEVIEELLIAERAGKAPENLTEAAGIVSRAAREMEHSDANLARMEEYIGTHHFFV